MTAERDITWSDKKDERGSQRKQWSLTISKDILKKSFFKSLDRI